MPVTRARREWTSSLRSGILFSVKVRDVIAELEADGWRLVRVRGSHRQFRHPSKAGTVTVAGKLSVDVPIGTLGSIWKQAGLKKN
jgi:predicted RNA binding protein YcfA (HicA-like mRNA interferase family)